MSTTEQTQLYTDWRMTPPEPRSKLDWAETVPTGSSREKEQWGVRQLSNAIFEAMDGAHVVHRGDVRVSTAPYDFSHPIVGDLWVAYEGKTAIFDAKAYLPRVGHKLFGLYGADQGLDWHHRQDYLNEQRRTGLPFYVVWVWDSGGGVQLAGQRVDLLSWPPHNESLNRTRGRKGAKMAYWSLQSLRSMREIAKDLARWNGEPFQTTLL